MRDRVFSDLGLAEVSRPDALRILAAEMLRPVLESDSDISMAVRDVRALCIEEGYAPELMDFYLLAFAHDDLQETGEQHYVSGATLANIQSLMRRRSLGLIEQVDETPSERFPCHVVVHTRCTRVAETTSARSASGRMTAEIAIMPMKSGAAQTARSFRRGGLGVMLRTFGHDG